MDARSVVSNEDDDKRSVASTTATTTSLASRIQSLAVDFGPKAPEGRVEGFPEADDEGDEEVIEIPEEQLLQELDRQEPAFQVSFAVDRIDALRTPRSMRVANGWAAPTGRS